MKVRLLLAAGALAALGAALAAWSHWWPRPTDAATGAERAHDPSEEGAVANATGVTLSDEKLASLTLRVAPAERRPLREIHVVPGRIQYDETKHVEIRAAADGILTEVRVAIGDCVSTGQVLALVSSPEIGSARTEVHHCRERWQLAVKKRDWEAEVSRNVVALIDALRSRVPITDLEKRFKDKTLGKSRDSLITAYSRCLLAESLARTAETAGADVLPTVTVAERLAERRSAQAALLAACEQARFDVTQQTRLAEIEEGDALRRLHIAQQRVTNLLHYAPDNVPERATEGDILSRVEIRAPFPGTIEEKRFAPSERVRSSDTILVLADTTKLWVAADIREQDWRVLTISLGQNVSVAAPALGGHFLNACVRHIGRQVDPKTNSVPLVAEIRNVEGLLRPGLFVHVSIPVGAPRMALCVPAAAVVQHEGSKFVFVRESEATFRRTDVTIGAQTDDWVEIVRGLPTGAPVVVEGAADLKSALLAASLSKED